MKPASFAALPLENREWLSIDEYARHLAKYVTCPSSIVAATANHYGRGRAISLSRAQTLVALAAQARKPRRKLECDDSDDLTHEHDVQLAIRAASRKLGKVLRLHTGRDWPCGHQRNPETTHWIAGVAQCKVCRRARWNAGFRMVADKRAALNERRRSMMAQVRRGSITSSPTRRAKMVEILTEYPGKIPAAELIYCVAGAFDMAPAWLKGPSRDRESVHARAVVIRILNERGLSKPHIAKLIGRHDHSTVLHSIANFDLYAGRDERVLKAYYAFKDNRA